MARGNANLHAAKAAKNDEFYTQFADIANELKHYRHHFKDKVVFCNCDDPYDSKFFQYFALSFNQLRLKKLIGTCYDGSPISGEELPLEFEGVSTKENKVAHKVVITEVRDTNGDGAVNLEDIREIIKSGNNVATRLHGNGDFRSKECIELLKEADIVVTNPPFSLFREYVAQLVEYKKQFLIIGNVNAITNKEFFPLIRNNEIWFGFNMVKEFTQPKTNEVKKFGNISWYTNLDITKRHEDLVLYKHYTPEEYPTYDNFNAINVDKVSEIPMDYEGVMGVPLTFLDKYNPTQFEIIWQACGNTRICAPKDILEELQYVPMKEDRGGCALLKGKRVYTRILIRRKR